MNIWKKLPVVIRRRVRQREGFAQSGTAKWASGYDLAGHRPLEVGDSPRSVSRRHFAKYGEWLVTEKFPDRRASVLFLVDISASGGLGNAGPKRVTALQALEGLGTACLSRGHILRAVAFTDRIERVTSVIGSAQVWDDEVAGLRALEPAGQLTDPVSALEFAWELSAQGTQGVDLVCVISDFLFPEDERSRLADLAGRADVIAVVVSDPMEAQAAPIAGTFVLRDVESGTTVFAAGVDAGDPSGYLDDLGIDRCRLTTTQDEFGLYDSLRDFFTERSESR
ncbi:MAG TPA: DUF58 domain-containing protein [Candidatus Paceibacterota bacterium]|nr:DUF58 domain-containing protein [Candidatus Paceibacterota bacterium]